MKEQKRKKTRIIFICASLALFIMFLKKSNYIQKVDEVLELRSLFEQNYLNYVCDNAGDFLKKQYKGGYNAKVYKTLSLDKGQTALINFIRDSKFKYIKDYYSRIGFLFIVLVLDIIFILFWISYCICCCCNCCCFNSASASTSSTVCRVIFFIISIIFTLFVIVFSFIVLLLITPFKRTINGAACSTLTLVDHFRDGLGNSYPNITTNRWTGISGLEQILEDDKTKFNKVVDYTDLNKKITYAISNYSNIKNDTCGIKKVVKSEDLINDNSTMSKLVDSSFNNINFNDQINNVKNAYQDFTNTENEACKDVYKAFHDYINKYVKTIACIFFIITLIASFVGLLTLIIYFISKSELFRIIYIIIWNILMLLMIITLLLSIVFGLFGFVLYDGRAIIQYIFSTNNLNNADPIFIKSDSYVANIINTCVNGNGEFLRVIQENEEIKNKLNDFNQNIDRYNNILSRLSNLNCSNEELKAKTSIIDVYKSFKEKNNLVLDIGGSLTNISCNFARNDEMIILGEIDDSGKFGIAIFVMSFLLGLFLGITILAGIIIVHKFKYQEDITPPKTEVNVHNDNSTGNINDQNNNLFSNNNI